MELNEIIASMEAILFAAGDVVPAARIAQVLGVETQAVLDAAAVLAQSLLEQGRGIRLLRLEDNLQLCSAPEYSQAVIRALEQRRPPRLSSAALEVLAIVAYFQPVTRAYIDQIRGVDSSYTVGALTERGLIEICGRLEAPGRPALFRTTDVFLRTMGISQLSELPPLPELAGSEGVEKLQQAIHELQNAADPNQIAMEEVLDGAKE